MLVTLRLAVVAVALPAVLAVPVRAEAPAAVTAAVASASITPPVASASITPPVASASITPPVASATIAPSPTTTMAEAVDESALRWYAAQRATARVEAEIRRLRSLHPGWEPPADLWQTGGSDERDLWDLWAADRIADLKAEIERRGRERPGWHPSADLLAKLHRRDERDALVAAAEAADWRAVVTRADASPDLLDGSDLDVVWRVAEASALTGTPDRALTLYRLALGAAKTPEERSGTVRKAIVVLGADAATPLLTDERRGPDGRGEFDDLRLDLARARIGDWLKPGATTPEPRDDITRLTPLAQGATGSTADAALLGWVAHRRGDHATARRWFDLALGRGGDGKARLGAALAAEAAGDHAGAVELATESGGDAELDALFLDLVAADLTRPQPRPIAAATLARYGKVTERLQSGDAAQALGWYAFAARRPAAAAAWFAKAMEWRPSAKSAEGHLLALAALGDRARLGEQARAYRARFPDLPPIEARAATPRSVAARPAVPAQRSCTTILAAASRPSAASPASALPIGWCLMDAGRAEEAAIAFERAGESPVLAAEAAYGRALAHLRSGRTDDAARVAAEGGLTPARRDEIGRIVLAQQAIAHFDRKDWRGTLDVLDRRRAHVDEPRDLMTLRAWALYHLGRNDDAHTVFALLDGQISTGETRRGLAVTAPRIPGRL